MSCRISFETDRYDELVSEFFKFVPPVNKRIEGNKVTYRFYNSDDIQIVVDYGERYLEVYSRVDVQIYEATSALGWSRRYSVNEVRAENAERFSLSDLDSGYIIRPIEARVREYISDLIRTDFNAEGSRVTDFSVNIPVFRDAGRAIRDAFNKHLRSGARRREVLDSILPPGVVELAEEFKRKQLKLNYNALTLNVLNFVWAHAEEIEEIKVKFPRLYAYLADYYQHGWKSFTRRDYHGKPLGNEPQPDNWYRRRKSLVTELRNYVMRRFSLTRSELSEWLTLDEQKFGWITKYGQHMGHGIALQIVREVGRTPAMTGLNSLDQFYRDVVETAADKAFLRQLIVEALKNSIKRRHRMGISQWLELEWHQVADWFRAEGRRFVPDKNQRNAKWSWFVRHSEEWHDRTALAAIASDAVTEEWTSLLPQHVHEEFFFVPLLSNKDLTVEGASQHHCVGGSTYINDSRDGLRLIWSVRSRENNRIATLELNRKEERVKRKDVNKEGAIVETEVVKYTWVRGQCLGKRNSSIETSTSNAANLLIQRYNAKYMETWRAEELAAEERVRQRSAIEAEKRRRLAKINRRAEKILEEAPELSKKQALVLAEQVLIEEEKAKAAKANEKRKHSDKEGHILVVDERPDDEVPPPIEDAEEGWVYQTPTAEAEQQLPDVDDVVQELVVEAAEGELPQTNHEEELRARLDEALVAAFEEMPQVPQEEPQPIEAAA